MFVFVWYALLYVYSSFGIRKRGMFALLLFSFGCLVTVKVREVAKKSDYSLFINFFFNSLKNWIIH